MSTRTERHRLGREQLRTVGRLYRRFSPHLRPHRGRLLVAALCTVGVTLAELARPWPIKIVFDGLLMPTDPVDPSIAWVIDWLGEGNALLAAIALSVLAIALVGSLLGFAQSYLLAFAGQRMVAGIRLDLWSHIQRLSHSFHDEHSSGDLLARLGGDVGMLRELLVNASNFVTARMLSIVGTVAVMALMDWRLTLVALVVLGPLLVAVRRLGGEIRGAARRQRRKESRIHEVLTERISAISVVQAYAREALEDERLARENARSTQAGLVATRLEAHLDRLVQVILAAGTAAVLWYGVVRTQAGAITPGDLLVFTAYLSGLYKPVRRLAALTGRIAKATVCGERILAILDIEPEIRDRPGARPAPRLAGEIVLDDVSFAYGPGRPVLEHASLRIAPGETVALLGPSGSGKSTIAKLLLRFYDPQAGAVRIDGVDVRDYTLESLRTNIALLLQEAVLFRGTLAENIAYGRLDATREEIEAAARAAGAHEFVTALPDGYDTKVGERGATLSGGQRQRIAIARAMVRDASIVVLDEPMAGLDADSAAKVEAALARLVAGRTCVLITHDWRAAARADRVLMVEDGRLREHRERSSAVRDMPPGAARGVG
ncbi:MAG: ABC transporter ATP-binding protein [Ectothiorhodospiraceae bacterium]|nr:ABC transporter ATP-binding protein [Chromatiales bacterium]MCP5153695.1 ABC transporter ATP-binding protein [Ectothiorhodospiraceae bacterium]